MKNNGLFDTSIFEAIMKPNDKFRVMYAFEIKEQYPKGYQILSEIGSALKFSTDEGMDMTPISEDTEKLFTLIEESTSPTSFMVQLMSTIGASCNVFINYAESQGMSTEVDILKTVDTAIRRLFIKEVI